MNYSYDPYYPYYKSNGANNRQDQSKGIDNNENIVGDKVRDLEREYALLNEELNKIGERLRRLNNNLGQVSSMSPASSSAEPKTSGFLNTLNKFDLNFEKLAEIAMILLEPSKNNDTKKEQNEDQE